MSSRCMAAVFERYPGAAGEFALALALADNAHDDGSHIFPSVELMAHKSRQSVRAVQLHLARMLTSGWLLKVRNGGGRGRCAEYRINPDWLKGADISPFSPPVQPVDNSLKGADIAPFKANKGCNPTHEKGEIHDTKGCNPRHPYITGRTSIGITPLPPAEAGGTDTGVENSIGHGNFASFFAAYPRKVGKTQAQQVWEKLAPDEALRKRIAEAVRAWARSPEWARNDGQYIPKPARWLREARWDDEPGMTLTPSRTAPPPRMVETAPLTPEQLKANGERARAAAALARQAFGLRPAGHSRQQLPEGMAA
jgi:hypothetical protein